MINGCLRHARRPRRRSVVASPSRGHEGPTVGGLSRLRVWVFTSDVLSVCGSVVAPVKMSRRSGQGSVCGTQTPPPSVGDHACNAVTYPCPPGCTTFSCGKLSWKTSTQDARKSIVVVERTDKVVQSVTGKLDPTFRSSGE